MHVSAFEKIRAFRNAYIADDGNRVRVLDVGSGCNKEDRSYRDLFPGPIFEYVGLDLEPGHNVDLVPGDPFAWIELAAESVDIVVSGQTFEHNPYFWITAAEIARVLVPGGLAAVVAPSTGRVHRFPLDCWRFYPDSWSSVCAYVGLDLLEGFTEGKSWRKVIPGVYWGDSMMVSRKPALDDAVTAKHFYDRLDAIVATRVPVPARTLGPGKAGTAYERSHTLPWTHMVGHLGYLAQKPLKLSPHLPQQLKRVRRRIMARGGRRAVQRGETLMPWPPTKET